MTDKIRGVWGWLGLACAAMLLAACSTVPTVNRSASELQRLWTARQPVLTGLRAWNISGRLAIQTKREGWHVSFHWQQDDAFYHIVLSGPLGQTSAELQGNDRGVTLLFADGHSVSADNPDTLLARQLGWPVPVEGLFYWARGLPEPDTAETHGLDGEGRLQWLQQSGWHISYRRYGDFLGTVLPTKIFLDNDRLKVRMVIDQWA